MAINQSSGPLGLDDETGRLPTNVKPTHYKLTLATDLKTFKFHGHVTITLDILKESSSITLHSTDLDIQEPVLQCGDKGLRVSAPQYNKDAEQVTLTFDETLSAGGVAQLSMKFSGVLEDDTLGIYRAKYTDSTGTDQWIMVSQMEPIACRKAFPCFDEPALKASFEITMIADKSLTCLSNMDVKRTSNDDEHNKTWVFNTTPPMSTYLVAFAVGEFNAIESNSFRVPVRIYTTPNNDVQHGQFALQLAANTMKFFEEKFGLQYPLTKVDMLGTAHFLGAMENWGLVIYHDKFLMIDEKTTDGATIQDSVNVIQHELAHQWFGNIVTMEYWDGLWLNESFATWVALYGNDIFYPEWKIWQFNLGDEYDRAFRLDSLRSSHPIEVSISKESEVHQIFDDISYAKGSCVLRMISKYTGEETFLEGVRNYLRKHEYKNTKTDDLWDALTEVSGKDIRKFGDAWTRSIGHPILTVTESQDGSSINIKQNRFLRSGDVKEAEDKTLLPIPLALRTSQGVDDDLALEGREVTIEKTDDFFKINADHAGFFRTLYQPERLAKLVEEKALLTPEDQFSLVNDAAALAAGGYQSTTKALWLLNQFSDSNEYIVWKGIIDAVHAIRAAWIFESEDIAKALEMYQRRLVSAKVHEFGWTFKPSDGQIIQRLKVLLFSAAVRSGDAKTVSAALEMFSRFKAGDRSAIDPNIIVPVYITALTYGDDPKAAYEDILNDLRTAKATTHRHRAQHALGGVTNPDLIERSLQLLLSPEVDGIEMWTPLGEICSSSEAGLRAAIKWLMENLDAIKKKHGTEVAGFGYIIKPCIGQLPSAPELRRAQEFFESRTDPEWDKLLEQSFDEARVKIGWVERDRDEVRRWLAEEGLL